MLIKGSSKLTGFVAQYFSSFVEICFKLKEDVWVSLAGLL